LHSPELPQQNILLGVRHLGRPFEQQLPLGTTLPQSASAALTPDAGSMRHQTQQNPKVKPLSSC
jgi:hypothetical protein